MNFYARIFLAACAYVGVLLVLPDERPSKSVTLAGQLAHDLAAADQEIFRLRRELTAAQLAAADARASHPRARGRRK